MSLRLGEIDLKKKTIKPRLFLCRPNKEPISILSEAYNVKVGLKLGSLNEISFTIPYDIDINHRLIANKHIKLVKGRYLIKLELGVYTEYYMITEVSKDEDDDTEMNIKAFSLGYELNDKLIRDYKEESLNATSFLNDILINTIWSIGYVDSEFDLKYRSLEISSNTVLECVNEIAKTFNALIIWDTINRKIELRKLENVGIDRGFRIKYGKYLQSISKVESIDEIVTRLKLYGKEGISIHEINPVGTSYIENFAYFMYPFKRDANRNVIEKSDYMEDDLCHAILDYNELIEIKKLDFNNLLNVLSVQQAELQTLQSELFDLETEMKTILDERDVENTLGHDTTQVVARKNSKQVEINSKNAQILAKEVEITNTNTLILNLKISLSVENNFTPSQIIELNQYIIEKEWTDENIENPEDLLIEGKKVFNELSQPKIEIDIDVVNFLSMVTEQRNWDKINLGDLIIVEHEKLNIGIQAKITEINYDFEGEEISLVITNVKDILFNQNKFLEMLYKSYSTSTQVDMDKYKWNLSVENHGMINDIINNMWDANKNAIVGAKNQVVSISDRGLIIRDMNDPNTYLVATNGVLAITDDGGDTWKQAITSKGIVGERIYGKIIMGVNLAIEDEHGVLKFQGSKGEIFDRNGNLVMKLGLVEENPDAFGLIAFNSVTKVEITDKTGIAVSRKTLTDWEKVFWSGFDGTLYSRDLVAERLKIVNDIGDIILDAENNYFDIGSFERIVTDDKLNAMEKLYIKKEWEKIKQNYSTLLTQANIYASTSRDNTIRILTNDFTNARDSLELYLTPLLADMTITDTINRAEFVGKFQTYYEQADLIRNAIEDSLKYSSVQLGSYYNNVIIDAKEGFKATRSDGSYRAILNATQGLSLEAYQNGAWVKKLYATLGDPTYADGTLVAEDLVARRLKIIGNAGQMMIDGDLGIIDLTQFTTIIGTLKAENISADIIMANNGFINDLAVNRLITVDKSTENDSEVNYIHIEKEHARWINGDSLGTTSQMKDTNGNFLYWTDFNKTNKTTKVTAYPVMMKNYTEDTFLDIYFTDDIGNETIADKIPTIEFGLKNSTITKKDGRGIIYHTLDKGLNINYHRTWGTDKYSGIQLWEDGVSIYAKDNNLKVLEGGFLVTSKDQRSINSVVDFIASPKGGFYVSNYGAGVYNRFQQSGEWGARWIFDSNNYMVQTDDYFGIVSGNSSESWSEKSRWHLARNPDNPSRYIFYLNDNTDMEIHGTMNINKVVHTTSHTVEAPIVTLKVDANNYITITSSGVTIKGSSINLN